MSVTAISGDFMTRSRVGARGEWSSNEKSVRVNTTEVEK